MWFINNKQFAQSLDLDPDLSANEARVTTQSCFQLIFCLDPSLFTQNTPTISHLNHFTFAQFLLSHIK